MTGNGSPMVSACGIGQLVRQMAPWAVHAPEGRAERVGRHVIAHYGGSMLTLGGIYVACTPEGVAVVPGPFPGKEAARRDVEAVAAAGDIRAVVLALPGRVQWRLPDHTAGLDAVAQAVIGGARQ